MQQSPSESQGQEEAACARSTNVTTGALFSYSYTKAVKFPIAVTRSSWTLPLSYYVESY